MRHAITVIGSSEQDREARPRVQLSGNATLRESVWYVCENQDKRSSLLDDTGSVVLKALRVPLIAYRFYNVVHNTRLWSGKRPLILVRGRSMASRVAAYVGTWGGGDVVKADDADTPPLGPTRYLMQPDGKLELRGD